MFHDLTLLPSQQWLLFLVAGLTMNLRLSTVHDSRDRRPRQVDVGSHATVPATPDLTDP